jgi:hypothetical protein
MQVSSTSYLKVLNVHAVGSDRKTWCQETQELFRQGLKLSPAGQGLAKRIKNSLRVMCNSRNSDTCTVWVDIHDTVSGSFARGLIGQFIAIASENCRIVSAKPHTGLLQCTRRLKCVTTLRVNSGCNERQRLEGNKAKSKLVKHKEYRVLLCYL